ncbi:hypothetical protein Tco_1384524 [Tanacetum coccineum]
MSSFLLLWGMTEKWSQKPKGAVRREESDGGGQMGSVVAGKEGGDGREGGMGGEWAGEHSRAGGWAGWCVLGGGRSVVFGGGVCGEGHSAGVVWGPRWAATGGPGDGSNVGWLAGHGCGQQGCDAALTGQCTLGGGALLSDGAVWGVCAIDWYFWGKVVGLCRVSGALEVCEVLCRFPKFIVLAWGGH